MADLRVKRVTGVWFLQGTTSFTPLSYPHSLYGLSKGIFVSHFNIIVTESPFSFCSQPLLLTIA